METPSSQKPLPCAEVQGKQYRGASLQEVAASGDADGALWLLRIGEDVNATDAKGLTALHHAANGGHVLLSIS